MSIIIVYFLFFPLSMYSTFFIFCLRGRFSSFTWDFLLYSNPGPLPQKSGALPMSHHIYNVQYIVTRFSCSSLPSHLVFLFTNSIYFANFWEFINILNILNFLCLSAVQVSGEPNLYCIFNETLYTKKLLASVKRAGLWKYRTYMLNKIHKLTCSVLDSAHPDSAGAHIAEPTE